MSKIQNSKPKTTTDHPSNHSLLRFQTGSQQPENIEFHISIHNPKHPLLPYSGFVEAANVQTPEQHDAATNHCPRALTPACQTPEQKRAEKYMSFQDDFHHPRTGLHVVSKMLINAVRINT